MWQSRSTCPRALGALTGEGVKWINPVQMYEGLSQDLLDSLKTRWQPHCAFWGQKNNFLKLLLSATKQCVFYILHSVPEQKFGPKAKMFCSTWNSFLDFKKKWHQFEVSTNSQDILFVTVTSGRKKQLWKNQQKKAIWSGEKGYFEVPRQKSKLQDLYAALLLKQQSEQNDSHVKKRKSVLSSWGRKLWAEVACCACARPLCPGRTRIVSPVTCTIYPQLCARAASTKSPITPRHKGS